MELLRRSHRHIRSREKQCRLLLVRYMVLTLAVLLFGPVPGIDSGNAEDRATAEGSVKLAYLYNFAKVIHWPPGSIPANEFTIGIVGNGSLAAGVDDKKEAGGKRVLVRHVVKLDHLKDCQIVFVPAAERELLPQVIRAVEGRPVVTVGDFDGFLRGGGMISLVSSKGKIAFDINVAATKKAGVTVGYQLLRLARELM